MAGCQVLLAGDTFPGNNVTFLDDGKFRKMKNDFLLITIFFWDVFSIVEQYNQFQECWV